MRILYALSDRYGSQVQYIRFLQNAPPNSIIKVAGYASKCNLINLDWNLDALKDAIDLKTVSLKNENVSIYASQIESFRPDLIISDLELITSYIAIAHKIPLWQVSPLLFYYATTNEIKSELNSRRRFSYIFKPHLKAKDFIHYAITNSSKNLIYSYFGDAHDFPIASNFEWVRPYFYSANQSKAAEHHCCATLLTNNKRHLNKIKDQEDTVLFSSFENENYSNIKIKNISNTSEYIINLKNSNYVACSAYTDFMADCFYNKKFANLFVDFDDIECVVNYLCAEHLNVGKAIMNALSNQSIDPKVNSKIKFFDQHLVE